MRMRKKVLIIVAVLMITIFAILYSIVNLVFLQSFATLEEEETRKSVVRTTNVLSNEIADISSKVGDWAFWDDTYRFVQDGNQLYVDSNLVDSTFVNLRLNLMLFINTSGQIVYGKAFDLVNDTETPISQDIDEEVLSSSSLWSFSAEDSKMEGIVLLGQELLMFSSKPVLTSLEEGPIVGALIMGRYLDSEEIAYLSNTVNFPLTVCRFEDQQVQSDFLAARSSLSSSVPVFVRPLSGDSVGGYALISDVYADPVLILRIDLPRDIYKQGLTTANFFIALVSVVCVVFGAAMVILLEKGMLAPLSKLTKTVREIGAREYGSRSVSRSGNDETSILTNVIKDAISQRLAAIEELAGMVGHDLRNPLTGIKGAAYYLRTKYGSKLDAKGEEMLRVIEDSVEYSNKIVNDLLEYSGKIKLEYVDITPRMLVKEALSLVNIPRTVGLIDLTENEPEMAVDADKMKRVFVNLIKNGVDAMPEGGSLTVRSAGVSGGVRFTFSDTGSGMTKESLERIGTPLFTTKAKGMGFGLPISKRLVEAHGGWMSFESIVGKGTTVTIFLPTRTKAETRDEIWVELPVFGARPMPEHLPSQTEKAANAAN
jgi:sensor domain CHASE-containing protein